MIDIDAELNKKRPKPDEYNWATYIPGRWPRVKVHRILAHAKSALALHDDTKYSSWRKNTKTWYERGCRIHQLVDDHWIDRSDDFKTTTSEETET